MGAFSQLLRWYDTEKRDLPWRKTRDPYRILVSEMMLQQTQVTRVLVFYRDWLKRFPRWQDLASASNEDVVRAWSGLGYNRRALALRDIARQVMERGEPKSREAWLELKGVGPYTSAALAAFALGEPVLPIDTNVRRVLGRVVLGKTFPQPTIDEALVKQVQPALASQKRSADIPQALFDLATSICRKTPACATCPLRDECLAAPKFLSGKVRTPKAMIKKSRERRHRNKQHPDRIYRGRILKLVTLAKTGEPLAGLGAKIDPGYAAPLDEAWLGAMLARLQKDGLLEVRKNRLYLRK